MNNVNANVASSEITGTTTGMQYSLDSTNGRNGTWTNALDTTTPVTFTPGKVYVRQANAPLNFKLVATIASIADAPVMPALTKKEDGSANVYQINVADTLEWSTDGSNWNTGTGEAQDVTVPATGGTVSVRTKATADAFASNAATKVYAARAAAPAAPTVTKKAGGSANVYQITATTTQEWSSNGTDWTTGTGTLQDVTIPLQGGTVSLRTKATADALASNASTKVYTTQAAAPAAPSVTKKADGSANEYEIIAATTQEWSRNGTDWTTGTGSAQNVTIPLAGATVSLRTKATDDALPSLASTKVYAQQAGAPSITHDVGTDHGTTKLLNVTTNQEYRVNNGSWTAITTENQVDNIAATVGQKIEVRTAATDNAMASEIYSYTLTSSEITP